MQDICFAKKREGIA